MLKAFLRFIATAGLVLCATANAGASEQSVASAGQAGEATPWHFGAGVSAGRLTPVMLEGSVRYKAATLHVAGFGFHKGANDFWCGIRGNIGWTFLRDFPFNLFLGVGGGYEFAEAPNEMHRAVNRANNAMYLYPYNYKELLDITADLRINLFGVFTQISFPAYRFKDHDAPDFSWRVGYLMEF